MSGDQKTLSLREAATQIGCSKETIRRAVAAGELPAIATRGTRGRELRVSDQGLRHWWQAHTGQPVAPAPETRDVPDDHAVAEAVVEPSDVVTRKTDAVTEIPVGWAEIHAQALDVAAKTLAQNQELIEQRQAVELQLTTERERAARAERQAEELRFVLTQHQRALSEVAESLAEERARAQAAELAVAEQQQVAAAPPEDAMANCLDAPRLGWGSRLRKWLLG